MTLIHRRTIEEVLKAKNAVGTILTLEKKPGEMKLIPHGDDLASRVIVHETLTSLTDQLKRKPGKHTLIALVPKHAAEEFERRGGKTTRIEEWVETFLHALGNRIPNKWIAGYQAVGQFVENGHFNPNHVSEFPQIEAAFRRRQSQRGPPAAGPRKRVKRN